MAKYIYTRGWIQMQVMSAMVDVGNWILGIANSDTELEYKDVIPLMNYISNLTGKKVEWKRANPGHGIKVSTVVKYLETVLNNGTPPHNIESEDESA